METNVGDRLREERARLGLSQVDFAAHARVTKTTQGNYEANKRLPDAAYLAAIARAGADVQYIVTGERSVGAGVQIQAVKQAVEKAFTMVTATGMAITPAQLAAMVVALLPEPAQPTAAEEPAPRQPIGSTVSNVQGHRNMVATGTGIVQVGGRPTISRQRKMKPN